MLLLEARSQAPRRAQFAVLLDRLRTASTFIAFPPQRSFAAVGIAHDEQPGAVRLASEVPFLYFSEFLKETRPAVTDAEGKPVSQHDFPFYGFHNRGVNHHLIL
jgi:hypothetical protein